MIEGGLALGGPERLQRVAVIGNGIIGHGVAQLFAVAGIPVRMIGRREASLEAARDKIRDSLARFRSEGLITADAAAAALDRISVSTELQSAADAELVIEAVTEDLTLKHDLFGRLDRICAPPAVLGSSSGQPASRLVARVEHRERVIAAHFWNPPQLIPLVEVCAGPETDPAIVPWLTAILRRIGKQPVVVQREIDGFLGNRLQFALLREALALWADGVASAEAIDLAVKTSFGRRLAATGPLESADLGGLETMRAFAAFLFPSLATNAEPPAAMDEAIRSAAREGRPPAISDWDRRDRAAVAAARTELLLYHLRRDGAASASARRP
ncbi:MAG TPA: 3-hydroxyacyl-CoA dehydrogenase family protein [bacterium]|nr:3-hydroxyacyl-CoA dehydrogenase family protein [bacterium]